MSHRCKYGRAFSGLLVSVLPFGMQGIAARLFGCSDTRLSRAKSGDESFHVDWLGPLYHLTHDRRIIDYITTPLRIVWFEAPELHASPGDDLVARLLAAEELIARFRARVLRRQIEGIRDLLFELFSALAGCVPAEVGASV